MDIERGVVDRLEAVRGEVGPGRRMRTQVEMYADALQARLGAGG